MKSSRRCASDGSSAAAARCGASSSGTISASKKTLYAAEQKRADVARARRRWMREQGMFDPARLVFIDESVLQRAEGVQHELNPFCEAAGKMRAGPPRSAV